MSEVILEFAEPLLDQAESDRDYENALALAVSAWNASLLPEPSWRELLRKRRREVSPDDHLGDDIERLFVGLIERKNQCYPDVKRLVLDFEYARCRSHWHLNVASAVL